MNDATAPKEKRKLAGDILSWYANLDIPGESDKGVVGQIADFRADCFWKGISTVVDHDARNVKPA